MVDEGRRRRRAGQAVARRLRGEAWGAARRNWRPLCLFGLGYLTAGTAVVWGVSAWGRVGHAWFFAGLMVGLVPAIGQAFLQGQGLLHRQMGAEGERWTAGELRSLDSRMWAVFHDVPLGGSNVDHVAIGPGRVYAIESKWTAHVENPRAMARMARQARFRADRLSGLLAERRIRRKVIPLLVVWGPRTYTELGDQPRLLSGTRVVSGWASRVWLARMNDAAVGFEIDHPARQAVADLVRGRPVQAPADHEQSAAPLEHFAQGDVSGS